MENYDIVSTIGRGASGKVFLVRNKQDARQYALKEITLDTKTNTKESVLKEAKILSRLKHPHVVACHTSFFDENEEHIYIVQDYCDGGNLQDKIFEMKEKDKKLNEKRIMQWFVQITMAVQHIHSNKILHRDLKTQNVFLTKRDIVKIGDFGIARIMENTVDMAQTCCGTPCYLSPELCQDVPYTSKSDIWALGCLLYEVCSLKPAFSASNIVSLFYKIVSGNVEPLPSGYTDNMSDLISQLMSKSPEDRPSAGAILNIPYVKDHLSLFIEGKEYIKEHHQKSPVLTKKPLPGSPCQQSTHHLANSTTKTDNPDTGGNGQPTVTEVVTSGPEYPDDFEEPSSDEAEYSDDFDDGGEGEECPKQPLAAKMNAVGRTMDEYSDDDFEDDDDSEESLTDVLACAKAAQDLEVCEETVADFDRPGSSCRDLIKEEVINVLGEKAFKEVRQLYQSGKAKFDQGPGEEFEKLSGSETMETCFLVNELFVADQ